MLGNPLEPPQSLDPNLLLRAAVSGLENRVKQLEARSNQPIVTSLMSHVGPLPQSTTLTTFGGRVILIASGSGYTTSAPAVTGFEVRLDGVAIISSAISVNENSTHGTFPTVFSPPTAAAPGAHIVTVQTSTLLTDTTDLFTVLAIELPL